MSKAIYGHMAGPDPLLMAEVSRLRRRVRELEEQVAAYEADLVTLQAPIEIVALRDAELDVALRELSHL
jgi:hypothetical protein